MGVPRSAVRYEAGPWPEEGLLGAAVIGLESPRGRVRYRTDAGLRAQDGWPVSRGRVEQVCGAPGIAGSTREYAPTSFRKSWGNRGHSPESNQQKARWVAGLL